MYRITVVAENCAYKHNIRAEHGLSIHIQAPESNILFDTGASDSFIRNARVLGLDISQVDFLVLSHAHSDHTGGLRAFLAANSKAKVICKRQILERKFKINSENGIINADELDLSRFQFIDQVSELVSGVFAFPDIEISNEDDTHFDKFVIERNSQIIPDRFDDELALVLTNAAGYNIISSCSHRGITNIISSAGRHFADYNLGLVLGGFHIHNAEQAKFDTIADFLRGTPAQRLGVCHCTGIDKFALFKQHFGERAFYAYAGSTLTIGH